MSKNTETLDKLYLEWSQFTKAETAKEIKLQKRIAALIAVLVDCEDYFDGRADADCDQDGFIPNEEMRLLSAVREAIDKVRSLAASE
ncbi:hypothetical protein [Agrobacterium pusense]|uniref:hypothetical protein n=1 Tax=Agrobacterium pusense TaxID=648995 RepID=UPI00244C9DAD|nr:hypothetical protein [Agrobacterium pusense]MDH0869718.1 hypothetical protein [Agrobacterium pusense]